MFILFVRYCLTISLHQTCANENFALTSSLQILRTINKILDIVHTQGTSCTLNLLTVHTCREFQNSDRGIRVVW
jgi:hypothetical protein